MTGFPECLDGRVKTLHPAVHAGLLADLIRPAHRAQLSDLGIAPFELLVSNLYPFGAAVAGGAAPEECVEQIDIGGPAMVRAAAKNHSRVAVITDPLMYRAVLEAAAGGGFTLEQRRRFAARAYAHTAAYTAPWPPGSRPTTHQMRPRGKPAGRMSPVPCGPGAMCSATGKTRTRGPPSTCRAALSRRRAAVLSAPQGGGAGITAGTQLHGKAMSYNNYVDAAAAWRAAFDFSEPCVAIIKHSNPLWYRGGRGLGRSASQGACLLPGVGLRRGDRREPAGDGGPGAPRSRTSSRRS